MTTLREEIRPEQSLIPAFGAHMLTHPLNSLFHHRSHPPPSMTPYRSNFCPAEDASNCHKGWGKQAQGWADHENSNFSSPIFRIQSTLGNRPDTFSLSVTSSPQLLILPPTRLITLRASGEDIQAPAGIGALCSQLVVRLSIYPRMF